MRFRAPPPKLFVYGTLCDAELFEIVAGAPMSRFRPAPAYARGVRALLAVTESAPIIKRGGGVTQGILLSRLTISAWRRICFYEEDDYRLGQICARLHSGFFVTAGAFWPCRNTRASHRPWSHRAWERFHKKHALIAASRFMTYVHAPAGIDLSRAWREIVSQLQ